VTRAYLSLGSNLGDRGEHLREGVRLVAAHEVHRLSRVYETERRKRRSTNAIDAGTVGTRRDHTR
jgi:7,8-dihydro-6-hydroxymethylpterin-pyrophosphokinase